ncbi:MAG: hypothetical protein GY950_29840 [bacterium]|nr:hypothetical protein [bacterium]
MSVNTAVHIGFSKTGTTTLQRHLFRGHPQIEFLGKPYPDDSLKTLIHRLMMQETLVYDPTLLQTHLEEIVKKTDPSKKVVLISDEMLLSYSKVRDKGVVAQRLKEIFRSGGSQPLILITIRNQFEILKAAYLSRGRLLLNVPPKYSGLHVSFEEWLTLSYENIERSYLGHIDYFKTIDFYAALFGSGNVCVLPLEEVVRDTGAYITKLSGFLGIDREAALGLVSGEHANRGISQLQLEAEALRGRWFPFHRFFPVSGMLRFYSSFKKIIKKDKDADITISSGWRDRLRELYLPGNRELSRKYELPLESYGYPL